MPDGGVAGRSSAIDEARVRIRDDDTLSNEATGYVLGILAEVAAEHDTQANVLDRLAKQFERRRDQAKISEEEFVALDEERAADFQTGRTLAMTDALAAVRAEQKGDGDE